MKDNDKKIRVRIKKLNENINNPTQHPKYIEVEDNELEAMTTTQKKYIKLVNDLTPEEYKSIKDLICHKRYSVEDIDKLARASSGKLHDKDK